jgi:hypothetical protein
LEDKIRFRPKSPAAIKRGAINVNVAGSGVAVVAEVVSMLNE